MYKIPCFNLKENNLISKLRNSIVGLFLLAVCLTPQATFAQQEKENQTGKTTKNDESDVKLAVENFLAALGNDEQEKVKAMMLSNANVASIYTSNGESKIFSVTADQYLSDREGKQNRKFQEPVRQYSVNISQGLLAFVRADATVSYDGKASHHTNDFFVLMKDNGVWKFLSCSYTTQPLEKDN